MSKRNAANVAAAPTASLACRALSADAVLPVTSTIRSSSPARQLPMVPRLLKRRLIISLPREASCMPSGTSLSPFNVFFVSAGLFTQHKIRRFRLYYRNPNQIGRYRRDDAFEQNLNRRACPTPSGPADLRPSFVGKKRGEAAPSCLTASITAVDWRYEGAGSKVAEQGRAIER